MKKKHFAIICILLTITMLFSMAIYNGSVFAEGETCKIIFVTNCNESLDDVNISVGELLAEPTLQRQHFTLDGWYLDADFTDKFDFSTTLSESITLFAKWNENPKITFDLNGGTGIISSAWADSGVGGYVNVPNGSQITKNGHAFYCWNTQSDGLGENVFDGINISSNITLYAKWQSLSLNIDENNVDMQKYETRTPIKLSIDMCDDIEVKWKIFKDYTEIAYTDTSPNFYYVPTFQGNYLIYAIVLNKTTKTYNFQVDYAKIVDIEINCKKIEQNTYKFVATTNDQSDSSKIVWFKRVKGDDEEVKIGSGKEITYTCVDDYYCYVYCKALETDCQSNMVELNPPVNLTFLLPFLIVAAVVILLFVPVLIKKYAISRRDRNI